MFGDDVCSTVSGSTMLSEFGGDEDEEIDEEDAPEQKYLPPVKEPEVDVELGSNFKEVVIKIEKLKVPKSKAGAPPPPKTRANKKATKKGGGVKDQLTLKEKRAQEMREKRANMTPEQKEMAKERERLRKQKARALERERREEAKGFKELEASEGEEDGEKKKRRPVRRSVVKKKEEVKNEVDSEEDEEEAPKKKRRMGGDGEETKRRRSGGGRKKRSEMGEEELEAARAKWREEARLKRALKRETMNEEERAAHLERQREQRRRLREKARGSMTEEKRREESQREAMRRLERFAGMTEDERRMERMSKYLQRMARKAVMTEEERERRRVRAVEWHRRKAERMTEEDREARRRRLKEYRDNMGEERRRRFLEKLREGYRRRRERMEKEGKVVKRRRSYVGDGVAKRRIRRVGGGEGSAEVKRKVGGDEGNGEVKRRRRRWMIDGKEETEEQRENRMLHRKLNQSKCSLRCRLKKGGASKEEIEAKVAEFERNYVWRGRRRGPEGETEEEKNERIRQQRALSQKKIKLRKKLEIKRMLESGLSIEEVNEQLESPEKREKTLIRQRIKWHKNSLRKRLESAGASPSEIERRLQELELTYQPTYNFRPYRPRPDSWKPIEPSDLALLEDDPSPNTPTTPTTTSPDLKPLIPSKSPPSPKKPKTTPTNRRPSGRPPKSSLPQPSTSQFTPQPVSYPPPLTPAPYYPQQVPSIPNPFYSQTLPHQNHFQIHYHQPPSGGYPQQQPYSQEQPSDYSNDYGDNSESYSPPPTPGGGGGDDDNSNDYSSSFGGDYSTINTYPNPIPPSTNPLHPSTSTPQKKKRGPPTRKYRPRDPTLPKKQLRCGPRGQKKKTATLENPSTLPGKKEVTCDLCGHHYPASYMATHNKFHHNPNYLDQTCQLCGEKFTVARTWYKHYKMEHLGGKDHPPKINEPSADKKHMCDICGASFKVKAILTDHKYYQHGDGLKKENFKRCPICVEDKYFKTVNGLDVHLRDKHVEYWRERMTVECMRCEERFRGEGALGKHVRDKHPESYFPCGYCEGVRFSKVGLEFHWGRCKKINKEQREGMREKGIVWLDAERLPCEFCERNVRVSSFTRHYWEVHGVKEGEGFTCVWCGKRFRVRDFWGVHMEEMHQRPVEEVREMVRKFTIVDREGLEVKNRDGCWGGVRERKKEGARKRRVGEVTGWKKWRRTEGAGGMKRNVKVICEEDEEEGGGVSKEEIVRRLRGSKDKKEKEETSEEDEEEEEEWRGSEED